MTSQEENCEMHFLKICHLGHNECQRGGCYSNGVNSSTPRRQTFAEKLLLFYHNFLPFWTTKQTFLYLQEPKLNVLKIICITGTVCWFTFLFLLLIFIVLKLKKYAPISKGWKVGSNTPWINDQVFSFVRWWWQSFDLFLFHYWHVVTSVFPFPFYF